MRTDSAATLIRTSTSFTNLPVKPMWFHTSIAKSASRSVERKRELSNTASKRGRYAFGSRWYLPSLSKSESNVNTLRIRSRSIKTKEVQSVNENGK